VTQFPEADRKRLHDQIIASVDNEVRPAYRKLQKFLSTEYAPKGRKDEGVWALPNGDALYRFYIRQQTTTSMDPESVHQLGLKEVARVQAEQLAIAKKLGFADLKSFQASLKTNPKLVPTSREDILEIYRKYIAQMEPELPKYFGLLPKTKLEVKAVEEYREKDAAAAAILSGNAGRVAQGSGDGEYRRPPTPHHTGNGIYGLSRRRTRPSYADFHRADVARASEVPPRGRIQRL
jgi:uncharacterized protein (DUF885 family)